MRHGTGEWLFSCCERVSVLLLRGSKVVGDTAVASARAAHPVTAAQDPDSEPVQDVSTKFFFCLLDFASECVLSSLDLACMA